MIILFAACGREKYYKHWGAGAARPPIFITLFAAAGREKGYSSSSQRSFNASILKLICAIHNPIKNQPMMAG
jgi:hypothetical protein